MRYRKLYKLKTKLKHSSILGCMFLFRNQIPSTPSLVKLMTLTGAAAALSTRGNPTDYYRTDGVRITHNPYSSEMESKYGKPGSTDNDGFDPYADTVGAGIYSGTVKRTADGAVEIGTQYQNHNPRKGVVPCTVVVGTHPYPRRLRPTEPN
mmetsp:Transcript_54546/g.65660  ORF Transcript_54546/g.65660 Transcript_54546/m.65660 type:complete len:151 (-) Transcript_54546:149-601(-)